MDGIVGWPGECSRAGGAFVDLSGAKNAPSVSMPSTEPENWTPVSIKAFKDWMRLVVEGMVTPKEACAALGIEPPL
jgi:hypothetical protein